MKLFICLLLGTAIASNGSSYEQREKNAKCLANFKADNRDFSQLLGDVADMDKAVRHARGIVHDCPVFDAERSLVIKRNWKGESMIYTTNNPRKCYDHLMNWIKNRKTEPWNLDDDHRLRLVHYHKTRDGENRRLVIVNDMDLWAAFLLQQDHFTVELDLEVVATTKPTSNPTTLAPTVPTLAPTKPSNPSDVLPLDGIEWINGMLPKEKDGKPYLRMADNSCYRLSWYGPSGWKQWMQKCTAEGYDSNYHKQEIKDKRGNGGYVVTIKTDTGAIFGSYHDINQLRQGGSYFYCKGCFLWYYKNRDYSKQGPQRTRRWANYAIYKHYSYGPCYGYNGGYDFCVTSPSSQQGRMYAGYTYYAPGNKSYPYYVSKASTSTFYITELETTPVMPIRDGDFYSVIFPNADDRDWARGLLPKNKKFGPHCYRMKEGLGQTSKSVSYYRRSCGDKGSIFFTILTTRGHIFGGYIDIGIPVSDSTKYFKDAEAFLWILKGRQYTREKLVQYKNEHAAVYNNNGYGPCMGNGHDMCISSPTSPSGYASIGNVYKGPNGGSWYIDVSSSSSWSITDWEAHLVVDQDYEWAPRRD